MAAKIAVIPLFMRDLKGTRNWAWKVKDNGAVRMDPNDENFYNSCPITAVCLSKTGVGYSDLFTLSAVGELRTKAAGYSQFTDVARSAIMLAADKTLAELDEEVRPLRVKMLKALGFYSTLKEEQRAVGGIRVR